MVFLDFFECYIIYIKFLPFLFLLLLFVRYKVLSLKTRETTSIGRESTPFKANTARPAAGLGEETLRIPARGRRKNWCY